MIDLLKIISDLITSSSTNSVMRLKFESEWNFVTYRVHIIVAKYS